MMNKIKKFGKDYLECVKTTNRFYKEHWLGCIISTVVICGIEVCIYCPEVVTDSIDNIKSKFKKNKDE